MRSDASSHAEPVPLLDLKAQNAPLRDHILAAITHVCDSQRFINGPEVDALERELSAMLGVRHAVVAWGFTKQPSRGIVPARQRQRTRNRPQPCVGLASVPVVAAARLRCTPILLFSADVSAGLAIRLEAKLAQRIAVPVPDAASGLPQARTFVSGYPVRPGLEARPGRVDIDLATYNIDAGRIGAAITPRTKAILPVHLFGLPADMDPIADAASRAGIPIVEDAAQAIGAACKGQPVGGIGLCGCFSFYPSKNLSAFGDAGLVTSNDDKFAARVRLMREHGMEPKYHHSMIGGNFRMDALQAAILRVKAPHLHGWSDARHENAKRYGRLFKDTGLTDQITLVSSTQSPHHVRADLAVCLGRAEGSIRVIPPDVGGSFGSKDHACAPEAILCALAQHVGRPIRWIEQRAEHLAATGHSREQVFEVEVAADSSGRILGLRGRLLFDVGAASTTHGRLSAEATRSSAGRGSQPPKIACVSCSVSIRPARPCGR